MAEAAEIAREAALAAPTAGRALAAANTALEWPEAPHLVLWHAQTVLREHRGDGHVAALLTAGLDPVETLVLFAADQGLDAAWLRIRRGLVGARSGARRRRGWPSADCSIATGLTAAGRGVRDEVEGRTDALAECPWAAVGTERADRLVGLVAPLVDAIVAGEGFLPGQPDGSASAVSCRATVPDPRSRRRLLGANPPLIRRVVGGRSVGARGSGACQDERRVPTRSRPAAAAAALSSAIAGAVDLAAVKARSEAAARQGRARRPRPAGAARSSSTSPSRPSRPT